MMQVFGSLALFAILAWRLEFLPGQPPISAKPKHFTVQVTGSKGVAFEATIHGMGTIGRHTFTGRLPRTYEFDAKGVESISVNARKTETFGEIRVILAKDGKVIAEKATMDKLGGVIVSGN
jgi:hypothetical protein